jgi:AsmA-like C-terminal region
MKKILKWTGITVGSLFLILLILPFAFSGKIEQAIKDAANENLNATVNWSDVSLSLIRNFPNLRITIDDLTVDNTMYPFDSVRMASIGSLEAVVDIKSLFGDQINIKRIGIVEPKFDIRVTPEGLANYDIAKPDTTTTEAQPAEEPSKFNLKLKEYFIENGTISYNDQTMPMVMKLEGLNHEGSGDFTQDLFKLTTQTKAEKTTFWFDGITYLNEVKTDMQADIDMDMVQSKYTLAGNQIKLNELEMGAQGWVAMPGENIDMDISFKALKNDFKQFLSMVPLEFAKDVSGVNASGSLALDGFVRGTYNDTSMPGVGLNLQIENGQFKYPDLPKSVDNIQVKASVVADMNVMDKTTVDVDKFHLEMAGNPIDMALHLRTPESDPFIDFMCKAFVDLDNVKEFIPLENNDEVHGQINADLAVVGHYSTAESGNYEGFDAHGTIDIKNVLFKSDSLPYDLQVNQALFNFTPAYVDLANFNARIGKSDMQANGKISQYLAYALHDSLLTGVFNVQSNLMDLNEFMTDESSTTATTEQPATQEPQSESMSPIELPGNIDFTLNAAFNKMIYDVNEITNVKGGIVLRNKIAYLNNLFMNVLDGAVTMNGNYNAQDLKLPKMDFMFDIKDMDINKSATQFATIDKLAPIAKACNGKFSTKMNLKSNLDQAMMPINPSVNGIGTLSTKNVVVKDFAPLVKLAEKINLDKLKEPQNISDVNVSFKIKDGVVNVDPFTVKMIDGIPMKVSGYTTLDQQINYNVDMDVPFDKFPSGAVNQASSWIGELNKKLGSNLSIGSKVNVIALITGTVTDPKIGVTSKALGEEAIAGLKEQALQAVQEQVTNLKNEALERAIAEKERLVNEAIQALDRALTQAAATRDNAKKQAEAAAKKAKDEAHKAADDQLAKIKNPLEKAAAKLVADKAKKVADEAYKKAVDKANKEADDAYLLADKNANKLVTEAEARGDKAIQDASAKGDQQINKIK